MVMASVWSWVTYRVVTPSRRDSAATSERSSARSPASRLDSGSSSRNTCGLRTIARAIATRCRWPPDRLVGSLRSRSVMPRYSATSITRVPISTPAGVCMRSGKPMFCATVRCG
jgi:hypothetical protein